MHGSMAMMRGIGHVHPMCSAQKTLVAGYHGLDIITVDMSLETSLLMPDEAGVKETGGSVERARKQALPPDTVVASPPLNCV